MWACYRYGSLVPASKSRPHPTALRRRVPAHVLAAVSGIIMSMEPSMRADISPLCIRHNSPMLRSDYGKPQGLVLNVFSWFSCSESGCNQGYDMDNGYHELVNGEVGRKTNSKPCIECGFQLYLAKRGMTTADTDWVCANKASPCSIIPRP